MAHTEEYFPRGGKKPIVTYFKQSSNFLGSAEQGERKKKKPKKKTEGDDGYLSDEALPTDVDQSYKNCAIGLSYKTVKPGLVILGRVRQILETKVNVMMPGKMMGMVMACHISEPYNKLLESYVNDETEKVRDLTDMFTRGQYVALHVLEARDKVLLLSMMPHHVNATRQLAHLHNGCVLQAAVSSVEDHGYVMDIGISNTRAFLPKKHGNTDIELDTGMITWCSVKSTTDAGVVTLSGDLDSLQTAVQSKSGPIHPATAVRVVIDKALENGIECSVFRQTTAYIQAQHAETVKGKKPKLGQKVRAHVLYVMPTRNAPFLTMRDIFARNNLDKEQEYKEGDIVEDAQVLKITGRSIHFKLGKKSRGMMSLKRIQVDEDLTDEQIVSKSYPIGSTHKVRILCYNLADYNYSVSDQSSVVNTKYFTLDELSPGDLVPATVRSSDTSLVLALSKTVTGCVPFAHMSDAGVYVDPKKAAAYKTLKKFKVGKEVQARVLLVNPVKHSLVLTLKPSLLREDLELLTSYQQAKVGKAYTGTIQYIRNYILVTFFNDVTALVPRQYVTRELTDNLIDAFHVGQIVNCTILRVDIEAKKMLGSLITEPFSSNKENPLRQKQSIESKDYSSKKRKTNDELVESPKKKKTKRSNDEEKDINNKPKNKRDNNTEDSEDTETNEKQKKKKKKGNKITEEPEETKIIENGKDRKRKKNKREEEKVTEESDAIETDFQDHEKILTPEDLGLIDLTDCVTPKQYKKRVVSLIKAFKARTMKFDKINNKIARIEEKGLNPKNKKFHTAMHKDKLVMEERIKTLLAALTNTQNKLKELGLEKNTDYKKKKVKKDIVIEATDKEEVKPRRQMVIVDNLEPALEVPSAKDFWAAPDDSEVLNKKADDSSSSEDEQTEQPKKKRKKLTVAEKLAKLRKEEERIRDMERRAIESQAQPRSIEAFERALLARPGCSQLWIAYMAFHLQATEIEKARAVGRKALNAISFREEGERLNVWLALLNCEYRFGTKESQQKTLEEALQTNDTWKVHSVLLDILAETGNAQELSALADLVTRKYKREQECYIRAGRACFKAGLADKARHVMQKACQVLDKKDHVSVLVQFALMERASGNLERCEVLFEQVLVVYPQRTDVCSVYIDQLVASDSHDRARQVLERMTSHKLPARKMKTLYRKWIELEQKFGTEAEVERIRLKAAEYLDKAKF